MYLSLDGSATLYVNSSIPALVALRGAVLDTDPGAAVDTAAVRAFYSTPEANVTRVTTSRRRGRRFVHVRLNVPDVTRLGDAPPFAWSTYRFARPSTRPAQGAPSEAEGRERGVFAYRQTVGGSAGGPPEGAAWDGSERVAFRIHVPSRVVYHNAGADNLRRGNIVVWEQPLADRLRGEPLALEVRMEPRSILYRTLIMFGAAGLAVALLFGVVLWRLTRKPRLRQGFGEAGNRKKGRVE